MLKSLLIGALSLVSAGALAADLPAGNIQPTYTPPSLAFSWTGLYVGVQVGYAFGRDTLSAPPIFPAFSYTRDGVFGGGHAGYNYQINQIVVGIEGDIDGTDANGHTVNPFNGSLIGSKVPVDGSLRGRVGFAANRALFFATGGAAFATFRNPYTGVNPPANTVTLSSTRVGWTVGGGIEYALVDNWSVRADYRYSDYGSFASFPGPIARINRNTDQRVEAGISYRFSTPTPVVARY